MTHPINNQLSRVLRAFSSLHQVHLMKSILLPTLTSVLSQNVTKLVCQWAFFKLLHVNFCIQCTQPQSSCSLWNRFTSAAYLFRQQNHIHSNTILYFPNFKRTTEFIKGDYILMSPTYIYFWWPIFLLFFAVAQLLLWITANQEILKKRWL
jgi:hypothetical protein